MIISRKAKDTLQRLCTQFPVVGITGPRQSGKTTLATSVFPDKKYITFDDRSMRDLAASNAVDFLMAFPNGAILDEEQKVPEIFDALKLLADSGLITLAEKDGLYELSDITENPKNLNLVELEAANTPNSLPDVDAAIINGNYALQRELNPATDALVLESSDPNGNVFINYLVVKEDNKDSLKTQALVAAFSTQEVVDFIEANYSGSVIPAADLVG